MGVSTSLPMLGATLKMEGMEAPPSMANQVIASSLPLTALSHLLPLR
jgi:hypothetical protein